MRNSRAGAAATGLAAVLWLAPALTMAQQPPTSLLPPTLGQPRPAPAPAAPYPVAPEGVNPLENQLVNPAPAPPEPPAPAPPSGGVLGTVPAGSLGTIPESALGAVTGGAFAQALGQFTGPLPAAAAQRAMHEILLDRAIIETTDPMARAAALYATGYAEDAAGAAIESAAEDVAGRALTARALLAVDQSEQACRRVDVDNLPRNAEPAPTFELLEVLALCKLEQGSGEASTLISGLLREQGGGDALYFAALNAASGTNATLPEAGSIDRVHPVHLALLRRAGIALPAGYADRAEPALLTALARDEDVDIASRITATERAVELGLLEPSSLVGLYVVTPLNEQLLMQASTGTAPASPLARAHLFALIADAQNASERLRFAAAMYAQGRGAGVGAAVAAALGEDIAGVVPDPTLGRWTPLAAEILVRADRARAAVAWVDAGEFIGTGGRPALSRFEAHRARALIAMSAPELGLGVAAGTLGTDAGGGQLSAAERAFITSEVTYMTALGDFVSPILTEIAGHPTPPPPAGEGPAAVLAALAPLSGIPLGKADDATIARALATLADSGRETEARMLAVEALIARSGTV